MTALCTEFSPSVLQFFLMGAMRSHDPFSWSGWYRCRAIPAIQEEAFQAALVDIRYVRYVSQGAAPKHKHAFPKSHTNKWKAYLWPSSTPSCILWKPGHLNQLQSYCSFFVELLRPAQTGEKRPQISQELPNCWKKLCWPRWKSLRADEEWILSCLIDSTGLQGTCPRSSYGSE